MLTGILKILFISFLIWLAYRVFAVALLLYRVRKGFQQFFKDTNSEEYKQKKSANDSNEMVKCAHCKTYVLKSIAISSQDKMFCSDEHEKLYRW